MHDCTQEQNGSPYFFSIVRVRFHFDSTIDIKSRLSLIVRVNVVLNRTVVVDSG